MNNINYPQQQPFPQSVYYPSLPPAQQLRKSGNFKKIIIALGIFAVLGGILLVIGIAIGIYFLLRRKKTEDTKKDVSLILKDAVALFDPREEDFISSDGKTLKNKGKDGGSNAFFDGSWDAVGGYPKRDPKGFITIKTGGSGTIKFPSTYLPSGSEPSTILQWIRINGDIKENINMILMGYGGDSKNNDFRGLSILKNPGKDADKATQNSNASEDPEGGNFRIVNCCGKDFDTGLTIHKDTWTLLVYVYDGISTFTAYLYDATLDNLTTRTKENGEFLNTTLDRDAFLYQGYSVNQDFDMGVSAIYQFAAVGPEIIKRFIAATKPST